MAATTHGYHIPNTIVEERESGLMKARCGGIGFCKVCMKEAAAAPTIEHLVYDDSTLLKVYRALMEKANLTYEQACDAVSSMQNAGILFREHL